MNILFDSPPLLFELAKYQTSGIDFYLSLDPFKNKLRIHLRKGKYKDRYKKIKPEGWGGYPELLVKDSEIDSNLVRYIKGLIWQAYNHK